MEVFLDGFQGMIFVLSLLKSPEPTAVVNLHLDCNQVLKLLQLCTCYTQVICLVQISVYKHVALPVCVASDKIRVKMSVYSYKVTHLVSI